MDLRVDIEVVRGDAGLAGIEELAPDGALRGEVDIGILVDDAGALAAELKRARGEIRGGFCKVSRPVTAPPVKKM